MNINIDPDTTPDTYIEHRELVRIGDGVAAPTAIRIGSSTGASKEAPVNVWLGGGLPPMNSTFLSDFTTRYMDPTEVKERFTALAAEFPNIATLVPLPNKTNGYQRKAQATLAANATTVRSRPPRAPRRSASASTTGLVAGMTISIDTGANQERRTIASIVTPNPAVARSERQPDGAADARARRSNAPVLLGDSGSGNTAPRQLAAERRRPDVEGVGPRGRQQHHRRAPRSRRRRTRR